MVACQQTSSTITSQTNQLKCTTAACDILCSESWQHLAHNLQTCPLLIISFCWQFLTCLCLNSSPAGVHKCSSVSVDKNWITVSSWTCCITNIFNKVTFLLQCVDAVGLAWDAAHVMPVKQKHGLWVYPQYCLQHCGWASAKACSLKNPSSNKTQTSLVPSDPWKTSRKTNVKSLMMMMLSLITAVSTICMCSKQALTAHRHIKSHLVPYKG